MNGNKSLNNVSNSDGRIGREKYHHHRDMYRDVTSSVFIRLVHRLKIHNYDDRIANKISKIKFHRWGDALRFVIVRMRALLASFVKTSIDSHSTLCVNRTSSPHLLTRYENGFRC